MRMPGKSMLVASGLLALSGSTSAKTVPAAAGNAALIRSAMSAAPVSVSRGATIVAVNPDGTMRTLRKGTNGITCMPDNPTTPGPDPMCMDANAMKWATAWMSHRTPPADTVGLMYMLSGGTDASNTDPYGKKPTAGNHWVSTGPHIMVVGSQSLLRSYPANATPDTSKPYVMWAGTPYAHLMVPVR
jgi:hypothetical protein